VWIFSWEVSDIMGFGKGKGFTSKIRVPMTEVVIRGGGGLVAKTEIVLTGTPLLTGGGGLATKVETALTETVELAEGSYP